MTEEGRLVYEDFRDSTKRLRAVLKMRRSVVIRDSSIKRFELTFELSWKLLKTFLADQGLICNSPKSCLQQAFSFGLIKDNPLWIDMLNDRNSSVHSYSEKFADALYGKLKKYLKLFSELEKEVKGHL